MALTVEVTGHAAPYLIVEGGCGHLGDVVLADLRARPGAVEVELPGGVTEFRSGEVVLARLHRRGTDRVEPWAPGAFLGEADVERAVRAAEEALAHWRGDNSAGDLHCIGAARAALVAVQAALMELGAVPGEESSCGHQWHPYATATGQSGCGES